MNLFIHATGWHHRIFVPIAITMFRLSRSTLYRSIKAQVTNDLALLAKSQRKGAESFDSCDTAGAGEIADNYLICGLGLDPEGAGHDTPSNSCYPSDSGVCCTVDANNLEDMESIFQSIESNSDCSTDSDCMIGVENEVADSGIHRQLADWAVKYNITLTALAALLCILRPHFCFLPADPRTLLKTPTDYCVTLMSNGGQYCYMGIAKGLNNLLQVCNSALYDSFQTLRLQFNVDGLPLFKSSGIQLWPILCMVKNLKISDPFVIALYCGKEKPGNAAEFMKDFIADMNNLLSNGFIFAGKKFVVEIHSFVCDAPARSFLKGCKGHSGYSSCEKCIDSGEYDGKMIFTSVSSPLRTDESFALMSDSDHHLIPNPLKNLQVGCVTQFGYDYMHMVCLGVVRRLLLYWKGPVGPLKVRLGRKAIEELSRRLLSLTSYIPSEFARKPRSLDDLLRWKATEFRLFLLYCGPVVLNGVLPDELYCHFLYLFCGITLLVSPQFAKHYTEFANDLLVKFVEYASTLYGKEILVYNTHGLIHLAADVRNLGPLDEFSCFPYENKLGQLKKMIRKPQLPIQQILCRLEERHNFSDLKHHGHTVEPVVSNEHTDGPVPLSCKGTQQFRRLETTKYSISLSTGNNCILVSGDMPVRVKNILLIDGSVTLVCCKFNQISDAFMHPIPSSSLNIFHVSAETTELSLIAAKDILCKGVCLPLSCKPESFMILPMLH